MKSTPPTPAAILQDVLSRIPSQDVLARLEPAKHMRAGASDYSQGGKR